MTNDESIIDFGLVIAYVLPGCVVLWGLGQISPEIQTWLGGQSVQSATFGGFLYIALAAIGSGLIVSTIRWFVLDTLHHLLGIRPPAWDFALLAERTEAYELLIENHYRYYKFYANALMAMVFAFSAWRSANPFSIVPLGWPEAITAALSILFFAASRDTLRKYYTRAGMLLEQQKGAILFVD